jgi:hypothetical protein
MSGSAAEQVIRELSCRAKLRPDPRRPPHPVLQTTDPASIQIHSERRASDRCAVAVAVNDMDGKRYFVIKEFVDEGDGLRRAGGSEGPCRDPPRRAPYLGLYAYANGPFFAGGRVQSGGLDIARVRLVWEDGYELDDAIENRVIMFFGVRESLDPAMVEFRDPTGRVVGSHQVFGPDEQ